MKKNFKRRSKVKRRRKTGRNKKTTKQSNKFTKILILSIFGILFISFVFNLFIHTTSQTVLTEYGQLTKAFQSKGLFVRKEQVVTVPKPGIINLLVPEGEKVRAGTLVAKVRNGKKEYDLYSHDTGLVSYYIDGLESTLTPKYLGELTYKRFRELKYRIQQVQEEESLNHGRPVYKIVDNFVLYLVIPVPEDKSDLFKQGVNVKFELLNFNQKKFSAEVERIINTKSRDLLVLKVKKFIPLFLKLRKTEVNLIRSSYNGIIVPISALVKKNSKTGVMAMNKKKFSFKEVKVLSKNQEKAVVKGINLGVKILREPTKR